MERERRRISREGYQAPEFKVEIEYSACCTECDFTITDSVKDANEKDAMANLETICHGTHYTIHRINQTTCSGKLEIKTKITYL